MKIPRVHQGPCGHTLSTGVITVAVSEIIAGIFGIGCSVYLLRSFEHLEAEDGGMAVEALLPLVFSILMAIFSTILLIGAICHNLCLIGLWMLFVAFTIIVATISIPCLLAVSIYLANEHEGMRSTFKGLTFAAIALFGLLYLVFSSYFWILVRSFLMDLSEEEDEERRYEERRSVSSFSATSISGDSYDSR